MCYSMIIVDDERIIREGLKKYIEKLDSGFCVKELFEDGKEAIEYLSEHEVDLVITDICMTEIDGLEVAAYIKNNLPDTEVVILSGYRNFEYAQKAISCGVTRYILKPVKKAEIAEILKSVRQCLDEKKHIKDVIFQYDEMLAQVRKQFFVDYMLGVSENGGAGEDIFSPLHFSVKPEEIYASVLKVSWQESFIEEVWQYGKDRIKAAVLNFFSCQPGYVFAMAVEDERFLVLSSGSKAEWEAEELKLRAKELFGTAPDVEIIYSCKGLYGLENYKKLSEGKSVASDAVENERRMLLCTYLNLGMFKQAKELFSELCESGDGASAQGMREKELIELVCENAQKAGVEMDPERYLRRLREKTESPGEVFESLAKYFSMARSEDKLIKKIREYVQANYAMDISLESVAEKVYLHPVYLSRFFKQQVGENFRDYLFSVRMTNAITLLKKNTYKIYEISRMVGYKSSKYFSRQFKSYTGYTPKNYCRIMWNINVRDE